MGSRGSKPTPIVERIMRRISVLDDGCWEYQGYRSSTGYGQITANPDDGYDSRTVLVHRVVWEHHHDQGLGDRHIDHTCSNTSCVNPIHLQAVSQSENNRLTRTRGRHGNAYIRPIEFRKPCGLPSRKEEGLE